MFLYHHSELPNQAYKCCKMEQSIGTTILSSLWLAEYIQHLSFQIYSEISIIKRLNFRALLFSSHYRQFAHHSTSLNVHTTSNLVIASSFNYLHTILLILIISLVARPKLTFRKKFNLYIII